RHGVSEHRPEEDPQPPQDGHETEDREENENDANHPAPARRLEIWACTRSSWGIWGKRRFSSSNADCVARASFRSNVSTSTRFKRDCQWFGSASEALRKAAIASSKSPRLRWAAPRSDRMFGLRGAFRRAFS